VTVWRAVEAREITFGTKPGIGEEALAGVLDDKRGVSDLTDVPSTGAFKENALLIVALQHCVSPDTGGTKSVKFGPIGAPARPEAQQAVELDLRSIQFGKTNRAGISGVC
jgi:hypothetical protein